MTHNSNISDSSLLSCWERNSPRLNQTKMMWLFCGHSKRQKKVMVRLHSTHILVHTSLHEAISVTDLSLVLLCHRLSHITGQGCYDNCCTVSSQERDVKYKLSVQDTLLFLNVTDLTKTNDTVVHSEKCQLMNEASAVWRVDVSLKRRWAPSNALDSVMTLTIACTNKSRLPDLLCSPLCSGWL